MIKKTSVVLLVLIFPMFFMTNANAQTSFRGKLLGDTIVIRIFGSPINLTPALKVKLSFSDPDVAHLDSKPPKFEALGATELLTEASPDTSEITVVWDGYITNNEAKITCMLEPGTKSGRTKILIESVEAAGGLDITNSIVTLVDPSEIASFELKDSNLLGNISILNSEELISPGFAAIAFRTEKDASGVVGFLNNSQVDFVDSKTGIATVDLPDQGGNLSLRLLLSSRGTRETVNIGLINILPPTPPGRGPQIYRANADNRGTSSLNIQGKRFGVKRFGKENTIIEVVPQRKDPSRLRLSSHVARAALGETQCIPIGSYVNIITKAGTAAKKIHVVGECSN